MPGNFIDILSAVFNIAIFRNSVMRKLERDCFIGYGAASLLKERMIDSSDRTVELVCGECGSLAVHDKMKNRRFCPVCEGGDVQEVEMSYAFKLLLDEMKSIGIFPKLKLKAQA